MDDIFLNPCSHQWVPAAIRIPAHISPVPCGLKQVAADRQMGMETFLESLYCNTERHQKLATSPGSAWESLLYAPSLLHVPEGHYDLAFAPLQLSSFFAPSSCAPNSCLGQCIPRNPACRQGISSNSSPRARRYPRFYGYRQGPILSRDGGSETEAKFPERSSPLKVHMDLNHSMHWVRCSLPRQLLHRLEIGRASHMYSQERSWNRSSDGAMAELRFFPQRKYETKISIDWNSCWGTIPDTSIHCNYFIYVRIKKMMSSSSEDKKEQFDVDKALLGTFFNRSKNDLQFWLILFNGISWSSIIWTKWSFFCSEIGDNSSNLSSI